MLSGPGSGIISVLASFAFRNRLRSKLFPSISQVSKEKKKLREEDISENFLDRLEDKWNRKCIPVEFPYPLP